MAIAARIPMIATTTSSSISVKPFDFFRFILVTLRMIPLLWMALWAALCGRRVFTRRSKRGATRAPRITCSAWGRGSYTFERRRPGVRAVPRYDLRRPRYRIDAASLHHRAELEDRQVHRDHQAADHDAEEEDDRRLEQRHEVRHRVVHLVLVEVGDLLQHAVEGAGRLPDGDHLADHGGGHLALGERLGDRAAARDAGARRAERPLVHLA